MIKLLSLGILFSFGFSQCFSMKDICDRLMPTPDIPEDYSGLSSPNKIIPSGRNQFLIKQIVAQQNLAKQTLTNALKDKKFLVVCNKISGFCVDEFGRLSNLVGQENIPTFLRIVTDLINLEQLAQYSAPMCREIQQHLRETWIQTAELISESEKHIRHTLESFGPGYSKLIPRVQKHYMDFLLGSNLSSSCSNIEALAHILFGVLPVSATTLPIPGFK